jgi:hypothetical protein
MWGRRSDDQAILRNAEEATAFASLVVRLQDGSLQLVYSSISFGEGVPRDGSLSASTIALREVIALRMMGRQPVFHDVDLVDTAMVAGYLFNARAFRKGQDVFHAAAALLEGAWFFVTGDDRLSRDLNRLYGDWGLPFEAGSSVAVLDRIARGARI